MIPEYRKKFNSHFSQEKYEEVLQLVEERCEAKNGFRISESPIFLPLTFKEKLEEAAAAIIEQIKSFSKEELDQALPPGHTLHDISARPQFLSVDFGICKDENEEVVPQLIELQAFPSLYAFKKVYEQILKDVYPFLNDFEPLMGKEEYTERFKKLVLGTESPENTVLLEIFPEKQKTYVDFAATHKMLGIPIVCLTDLIKDGNRLYYEREGRRIRIKRIYNRVIFDELDRMPNLKPPYDFKEDVDVEWIAHPNWFFKISKYILPKLEHRFIPKSYFLSEFPENEDLSDFVLKPLFSFAGSGIDLYPTKEKTAAISDKENYILQRKVRYAPLFEDLKGGKSKAEIRMLFFWDPEEENPVWVTNLVRMTKAEMVNVDFNKKGEDWIGSSFAFFG